MRKGQERPVLWMWDEGDFKKIEKPLEGLLLKTVLFLQEFLKKHLPLGCALEESFGGMDGSQSFCR